MPSSATWDRLTAALGRLPGVGRRSAERMALKLVRERDGLLRELREALDGVARELRCCARCGSVTPAERDPCDLCTSARRDGAVLCVVEDPADIGLIERSGEFHGRYHALMGRISPMRGEGRADLRVDALVARVREEGFREVILATNTDVEGEATARYLADVLRDTPARISRLALGLPAGSGIRYADAVTLARAISGRHEA